MTMQEAELLLAALSPSRPSTSVTSHEGPRIVSLRRKARKAP